mmetsp:Transcript_132904/g.284046  ORF Transcript_132904/g.284046 Transcript_132904/m.284046 type:complete len:211 (+) Transcript_132904:434-1066(+)
MCGASVHQVVVDMHIRADVVLLAELIAKLEGLLRPLAPVRQLDNDGECEVAGPHTKPLHVRQKPVPTIPKAVARAAIEEGVVGDLIGAQLRSLLHIRQKLESPIEPIFLAIAFDDRAVCDHVRLDVLTSHLLQELLDTAHGETPGAHVDERIVCHNGELEFLCAHLLVYGPYTLKAFRVRKTLQHGAIDNGVKQGACLRVIENRLNELIA